MRKNDSIARMKNRTQAAKQRDHEKDDKPVTVAETLRKPASEFTAQINVRLTPQFRNELNAYCAMNGITVQELVPALLEEHMRNNPLSR